MESRNKEGEVEKSRLPTFKCPRDLTLTATANKSSPQLVRSRKNFVPNIPPKRDRSASATSSTSNASREQPQSPSSSSSTAPPNRSRYREKKKPELIQSTSIFSEGVGDSSCGDKSKRRHSKATGLTRRGVDGTSNRPTSGGISNLERYFRTKDQSEDSMKGNHSYQEVRSRVHEAIGDGKFIADLEDEDDEDIDPALDPVTLPLTKYLKASLAEVAKVPVSLSLLPKIKSDLNDDISSLTKVTEYLTLDPLSFAHALTTAPPEGTILYFQMPDQLPVLDQSSGDSSQAKEAKLSNEIGAFPEGYIGKIQVLASGASRLVLGENAFEIEPAKPISFRQELAAVDLENKTMTALGHVKQKFLCTPELDYLYKQV